MKYRIILPVSMLFLSVSFILSALCIANSINQLAKNQNKPEKVLMTEKESADYLNISLDDFNDLLVKDQKAKKAMSTYGTTSHDVYQFIPYININYRKMFCKSELDEWIKYNMNY